MFLFACLLLGYWKNLKLCAWFTSYSFQTIRIWSHTILEVGDGVLEVRWPRCRGFGSSALPTRPNPSSTSFPHHFLFGTCWPSRFLGLPISQLLSPSTHFPPGQHWSTPGLRKATWIPHVGIQVFLEDHCEAQLLGSNSFPNQGERKDPTAYSLFPQPRKAWRWPGTWMEHRDGEMGGRSQGGLPGGGCTLKEGRTATGVVF